MDGTKIEWTDATLAIDLAVDRELRAVFSTPAAQVLNEVAVERQRQDSKWGKQDHHPMVMLAILGEEVGEANQAALQSVFGGRNWSEYRKELIQTAAVAVQMVENFDRNGPPAPLDEAERSRYLMGRKVTT